jgi:SAM-dependent methyltransferase
MKDSEPTKSWYNYSEAYPSEQRKIWYDNAAEAYNKTRPRYPQELISRVVELTQLPKDAIILELGCGPGIATTSFAKLGFSMVCIEPSQEACKIARQNCIQYPDIEIINTTFEEWELEKEKFNAVLSATSFHWLPAEIRYSKTAAALKNNGFLILLWNVVPPLPNPEIYQILHEVYQTHAPSVVQQFRHENRATTEESLKNMGESVSSSGNFKNLIYEQVAWEFSYSIDDYLTLLSTLSPYIALEPDKRDSLFSDLKETLESNDETSIHMSYLSAFHIAQKI